MTRKQEKTSVLTEIFKSYKDDPVFFVEHCLGHVTWGKQREILRSVWDNEKTAVRASHGVSKTYSAAEIAVGFLNCFDNSKVITTAPTHMQVKDLLWAEIGHIYRTSRIRLEGECLTTMIKTDKSEHFAVGFSTDKPQRAEGWHAPAILFIFDEAKGIPPWMFDSVRGLMTGGYCRWLAISTTDGVNPGEPYANCFDDAKSDWHQIHISAFDSPYVTGEKFRGIKIPDLSRLDKFESYEVDSSDVVIQIASPKWIKSCKREWGIDSVLYKTKILGEIDDGGADTIIKLSQVTKMFYNSQIEDFDETGAEEVGVDVAYGGEDDTVFVRRKGFKVIDWKVIPPKGMPEKAKTVYLSEELEVFVDRRKDILIKVDVGGVGAGVVDNMQDRGYDIFPIYFQMKARRENRYANAISEAWYETAQILDDISCREDNRLQTELVNRKGTLDKKGRRIVESKDDYKKRGFRSPDVADAFLLCFYGHGYTREIHVMGDGVGQGGEESMGQSLSGDDWEQKMISREQKPEPSGTSDRDKQVELLVRPEVAKAYIQGMADKKGIDAIAKELGVDATILRLFVQKYRNRIASMAMGDSQSGKREIEII